MKSLIIAISLLVSLGVSSIGLAADPFTPEQRQELEKMLAAERSRIREEVRKELLAELAQDKSVKGNAIALDDEMEQPAASDRPGLIDVTAAPLQGEIGIATVDQQFSSGGSGIELSAAAGDSDAAIVLAKSISTTHNGRFIDNTWRLTTSTPIDDEDKGRANFGTLSGFANGLTMEFSWTHASTKQVLLGGDTPSEEWQKLCALSEQETDGCTLGGIDAASKDPDAHDLRSAYEAFQKHQYSWGRLYNLNIGASRNSYDYLDGLLDEQSETNIGWTVGGAVGFSTPKRNALYAFGFDLERTYEEQDENVYCPALFPTPCITGRLGPPAKDWNRLLWVEARSSAFKVPFSFRVTRELEDDITGIDMPIYLLHDEDGAFTGGIRLGWTSEDGFDAGVFVGTGFDVFE